MGIHSSSAMLPVRFLIKSLVILNDFLIGKKLLIHLVILRCIFSVLCCISYWSLGTSGPSPGWWFHSSFQLWFICKSITGVHLYSPSIVVKFFIATVFWDGKLQVKQIMEFYLKVNYTNKLIGFYLIRKNRRLEWGWGKERKLIEETFCYIDVTFAIATIKCRTFIYWLYNLPLLWAVVQEQVEQLVRPASFSTSVDCVNSRICFCCQRSWWWIKGKITITANDVSANARLTLSCYSFSPPIYTHLCSELQKLRLQETAGHIVDMKKRALNDRLMLAEKGFLDADGLQGRKWFKHLVSVFMSWKCRTKLLLVSTELMLLSFYVSLLSINASY